MKKLRFLAMVMAAAFTLSFVSCGDDDIEYEGVILEDGDFIEIGASTQNDANYNQGFGYDTTAAYPAHFKVTLRNGKLVITNLTAQNTAESLQIPGMNLRDCQCAARIGDYGKVNALSKINTYLGADQYSDSVAAEEKHGYVVEVHGTMNFDSYGRPELHDLKSQHMRIWLEEATDKGYKVRYEYPYKEE
ncbi:MAG: hypothetical protein IKN84_04440 [Bacteroidales bacterium]|jgi:hypothetical protein|nr:hypothetical protein [Bacteroidales bacterium]